MIIDTELLDKVAEQAKASPRLRMNYNFHQSLDELCHRFINAVEPGTEVPWKPLFRGYQTFIRHPGIRAFSVVSSTKLPKIGYSCNSIKIFCTLTVNESYRTQQGRLAA